MYLTYRSSLHFSSTGSSSHQIFQPISSAVIMSFWNPWSGTLVAIACLVIILLIGTPSIRHLLGCREQKSPSILRLSTKSSLSSYEVLEGFVADGVIIKQHLVAIDDHMNDLYRLLERRTAITESLLFPELEDNLMDHVTTRESVNIDLGSQTQPLKRENPQWPLRS
ncbi:hypothetical protein GGI35DRAFT_124323 [Trichoderma velutinum]